MRTIITQLATLSSLPACAGTIPPRTRRSTTLDKIIATFCIPDDLLHIRHHRNDPQAKITDREILNRHPRLPRVRREYAQSPPVGQSPPPVLVCAVREPFQPQAAPSDAPATRPCATAARRVGGTADLYRRCAGYFSDACVREYSRQPLPS